MGSNRPRSNPTSPRRSPAGDESEGEWARLHRNRPLTWRFALLLLVPLAVLAAGSDVAVYASVRDHYARHGHLALPLDLALMALALTALAVYGWVTFWRGVRKSSGGKQAVKPPSALATNPKRKERP